jgi:ATP-binding cassette subfamily B protein
MIGWLRAMPSMARERVMLVRMLRLARPRAVAGFVILAVVTLGAPIAMALLTARLVSDLQASASVATAIGWGAGIAVSIVALQLAQSFRAVLLDGIVASVDGQVRSRLRYAAGMALPFRIVESTEFQDDTSRAGDPGVWESRSRTAGAATAAQLWLTLRLLTAVTLAVVVATVNAGIALAVLVGVFVNRGIRNREFTPLVRASDADAHLARDADVIETAFAEPRHAREFSIFGFGPWFVDRWSSLTDASNDKHFTGLAKVLRHQWLSTTVSLLIGIVTFGWLAIDALAGRIEAGQIALVLMAVGTLIGFASPGWETGEIDYGLASVKAFERVEDRVRAAPARVELASRLEQTPLIEFDEVRFSYGDRSVLAGVDLRLNPGERLAIVGRNGAGKSTLTKLVGGLYLPDAGSVSFDGIPTTDPEGLAAAISSVAVMYQESLRLPLDVKGNVTMGRDGEDDEVWSALDVAGLADVFRREGVTLDTPLWNAQGDSRDLSGGQWQRIALARAVFAAGSGKRVLILDEPTSQFDVAGETAFYDEVMGALHGITVVLITHRLSTIRRADRIAMLHEGRISEIGSHAELMTAGGGYATMFRLQAERFAESER